MAPKPPQTPENLSRAIVERYATLSRRLQQIARYALDHPNHMALQTIAVISKWAGVQPSALIRFAKAFGYSGFSDMQRVFRARLGESPPSYEERLRLFRERLGGTGQPAAEVLRDLVAANVAALERLAAEVALDPMERAVELLASAGRIRIIGQRRSFPLAAYFAYALSQADRRARLLDGIGGMLFEQADDLSAEDVLIAISFPPYAPETAEVVARAVERGASIIVITDTALSPIAGPATVCLHVRDAELQGCRSLAASLCLAQALVVALGVRAETPAAGGRDNTSP